MRATGEDAAVTVSLLQQLLQSQTSELKAAQQADLQVAVDRMEANTAKQLAAVREQIIEVKTAIKDHEDQLGSIKSGQLVLEKRLVALEAGGSHAGSTTDGELGGRMTAVVGGWPSYTNKQDLLREMEKIVDRHNLSSLLDEKFFTTGLRRGFAMVNFRPRTGEHPDLAMKRLMDVVQTIRLASIEVPVAGPQCGRCSMRKNPADVR